MSKPLNLVIVESPSKAKTIGKYLGPEYTVKASMGHLRDLPKSTMGGDFENGFKPDYRPITGKKEIIDDLKSTAAKVDAVYLATDPDREGEAISWHQKELLGLPDDPLPAPQLPHQDTGSAGSAGHPCGSHPETAMHIRLRYPSRD